MRYDAAELSADPRSRRSRTVGKDQLALVLDGIADTAHAYSFFATNEPLDLYEEIAAAEWEFRRRTRIEELFRDTAYGAGLNHVFVPVARTLATRSAAGSGTREVPQWASAA